MKPEEKLIKERKEKLEILRKKGIEPYAYVFNKKNYSQDILDKFSKLKKGEGTKTRVVLSGRITSLRIMGKASFGHIQDTKGKIQFYLREDQVGKECYENFRKLYDIGDIVGLNGFVFRTKMGEISIKVKNIQLLTKSLRPLPEKWHGLKDKELRYRRRYLDLIVNPNVKKVFETRKKIIGAMREFLVKNDFIEVETPILQPVYGGTNAEPFKSHLNALKMAVYMRISNEMYLKRLIVGGYEKIFEFSADFRNEGIDKTHNPEFTQMETMWAYADYKDNMKFCEEMIKYIVRNIHGKLKFKSGEVTLDFSKWEKLSFVEALKKYAKVDFDKTRTLNDAKRIAKKFGLSLTKTFTKGEVLSDIFENVVEPKLIQPTFIYDFPREQYVLAKEKRGDPRFSEAFEPYVKGIELGLSYSEQNDPTILKKYWQMAEKFFKKGDVEAQRMDKDFIRSLEYGMPPTSGVGVGIDRLTMLLTNSSSIRDVILFPFMKPEEDK